MKALSCDASVVSGGYAESISAINSRGRAAAARLRGNGGSGNASALTSPLLTWTVWGATSSPGAGPCPALIRPRVSHTEVYPTVPKTICYIRDLWRQLFCLGGAEHVLNLKPANNNSPFLLLISFWVQSSVTITMQMLLNMKKGNTFLK